MNATASLCQPAFIGLIGVVQTDITPPAGIYARNWGAASHDVAEGIHRPLVLTCITLQPNPQAKPYVLIGADLGWWKSRGEEEFVRQGIVDSLSLDPAQVMVCLSHTHSGPCLSREDAHMPGGELIEPYLCRLRATLANTVTQALADASQASLTWRYGRCDLATNRDLDQEQRCVVGFNPLIVADDTLLVGRITDCEGRMRAVIINYACHPTTLAWENRLLSPDYVGAMRELIEWQSGVPCLFLQGASGELAPAEQYSGDPNLADAHGRRLGYAVLSTLEGMLPASTKLGFEGVVESGAALGIWNRQPGETSPAMASELVELEISLKPMPTLDQLEAEWRITEDRVTKERLRRQRGIRKIVGNGSTANINLYAWRLGDSLLFGQPGEAYSYFQQQLRQHFFPRPVAVMNIVNGYASYLPTQSAFSKEIYSVTVSPYQAGACESVTVQAIEAGERLAAIDYNQT